MESSSENPNDSDQDQDWLKSTKNKKRKIKTTKTRRSTRRKVSQTTSVPPSVTVLNNWENIVVKEEQFLDSDGMHSNDEADISQLPEVNVNFQLTALNIGDVCDLINYIKGYLKMYLNGHIFSCNRVSDNIFYWQCESYSDCISQAVTILNEEKHLLKSLDEHTHPQFDEVNNQPQLSLFLPKGINLKLFEKCEVQNSDKLMRNGYFYTKQKTQGETHYWLCERNISEKCGGSVLTVLDNDEHFLKYANEHNHFNNIDRQYEEHTKIPLDEPNESVENSDGSDVENDRDFGLDATPENQESNDASSDEKIIIKKEIINSENENLPEFIESENIEEKKEQGEDPLFESWKFKVGAICEFIKSQRGNPKLCINNYVYHANKKNYWVCEDKHKHDCKAYACTELRSDGNYYLKRFSLHNHVPKADRKATTRALTAIREKCISQVNIPAMKIIDDEFDKLPKYLQDALPSKRAIAVMVARKRRAAELDAIAKFESERELVPKKMKSEPLPDADSDIQKLDISDSFETDPVLDVICEIVGSTKGQNILVAEDYIFNFVRSNKNVYQWICELRQSQRCLGSCITVVRDGIHFLRTMKAHVHKPNPNRKILIKVINKIKELGMHTSDPAKDIVDTVLNDIDEEILKALPSKDTLIRNIQKNRTDRKKVKKENENKNDKNDEEWISDMSDGENVNDSEHLNKVCETLESTRGNSKLLVDDYLYTLNKIQRARYTWVCEFRTSTKCMGFAVTTQKNGLHYMTRYRQHDHPPNPMRKHLVGIDRRMKALALATEDSAATIVDEVLKDVSEEILKELPDKNALCRKITRQRRYHKPKTTTEEQEESDPEDDNRLHDIEIQPGSVVDLYSPLNGGNLKLNLNGFHFHKHRIHNEFHHWQCDDDDNTECRGYAITILGVDGKHYMKKNRNHNHTPKELHPDFIEFILRMKEKAHFTIEDPEEIYRIGIQNLSEEKKIDFPQKCSIMGMMQRVRKKVFGPEDVKDEEEGQQLSVDHSYVILQEVDTECEFIGSSNGYGKLAIEEHFNEKQTENSNEIELRMHYTTCNILGEAVTFYSN